MTWATKLVSLHALFDEVNWEPLGARNMKHRLLLLYKMFNNLSPEYLSSLIPPTVNNVSRYNLPNAHNIQNLDSRTTQYFNSFCRLLLEKGITCHLTSDIKKVRVQRNPSLDISMQVIGVIRYFTPAYVQSVVHLTTTSFRNVSMIHLSVSVVMWKILITTFCIVYFTLHREQNLFMKSPSTLQLHYKCSYLEILYCPCTQIHSFLNQFTNISLTRSISNPNP